MPAIEHVLLLLKGLDQRSYMLIQLAIQILSMQQINASYYNYSTIVHCLLES